MHIVRFHDPDGKVRYGERVGADTARLIEGDLYGEHRVTDQSATISKLLAPVEPRSILCIGLNYRKHAEESGAQAPEFPVLFMKAVSAVQNPGDPILIPRVEPDSVDYECELAVVIGKAAKNVPEDAALSHVLGYTCANDVSGRDWSTLR